MQKIKFNSASSTDFFTTVKKRVEQYFEDHQISKNANYWMVIKIIFYFSVFIVAYALIHTNLFSIWWMLVFAIILGFFSAFIGLNVGHDAIHGSLSSNPFVNKILGYSFNLLGANDYMWSIMHNIVHHTFTNIPGHDEDIEGVPFVRFNDSVKLKKMHRYQFIYAFFFYCFTTISWVFVKDFKKFFQKKIGNYDNKNHPPIQYFNLFFFKALYYIMFLIIPLLVLHIAWWQVLIGFFVLHVVEGLTLAIVFQMAHVVEGTEFPEPDAIGQMDNAWAVHQMKTTANFARKNPIVNFLVGGLNFQIEHHLFPQICHVHYRKLSEIVKATAEEFNVPYIENRTFRGAILSHIRLLKKYGRP